MSFFKDFKEDLSQAVNELLPGEEELKSSIPNQQDLVVNTLEQEVDVQSELKKLEGLFEKVDETAARKPERPVVPKPGSNSGGTKGAESAKRTERTKKRSKDRKSCGRGAKGGNDCEYREHYEWGKRCK